MRQPRVARRAQQTRTKGGAGGTHPRELPRACRHRQCPRIERRSCAAAAHCSGGAAHQPPQARGVGPPSERPPDPPAGDAAEKRAADPPPACTRVPVADTAREPEDSQAALQDYGLDRCGVLGRRRQPR